MNAKLLDRRAIQLSSMKNGQIAIAVQPIGSINPYRPIYARTYTNKKVGGDDVFIELTNLQNQYMYQVIGQNPMVVLLEENQSIELSSFK